MNAQEKLFSLRIALHGNATLAVTAFEGPRTYESTHTRVDVQAVLRHEDGTRETIFNRGDTWCGIPGHASIDGDYAREAVLSLLAMKPGDTDSEYFESYTPRQLEFANQYGDELTMVAFDRYGEP